MTPLATESISPQAGHTHGDIFIPDPFIQTVGDGPGGVQAGDYHLIAPGSVSSGGTFRTTGIGRQKKVRCLRRWRCCAGIPWAGSPWSCVRLQLSGSGCHSRMNGLLPIPTAPEAPVIRRWISSTGLGDRFRVIRVDRHLFLIDLDQIDHWWDRRPVKALVLMANPSGIGRSQTAMTTSPRLAFLPPTPSIISALISVVGQDNLADREFLPLAQLLLYFGLILSSTSNNAG